MEIMQRHFCVSLCGFLSVFPGSGRIRSQQGLECFWFCFFDGFVLFFCHLQVYRRVDVEEDSIFLLILADRYLHQINLGEEGMEQVIPFGDFLPHERHETAVIHGMETDVGSILDRNDGIGRLDVEGHLFNHGNGNERHVDANDEDIFRVRILE